MAADSSLPPILALPRRAFADFKSPLLSNPSTCFVLFLCSLWEHKSSLYAFFSKENGWFAISNIKRASLWTGLCRTEGERCKRQTFWKWDKIRQTMKRRVTFLSFVRTNITRTIIDFLENRESPLKRIASFDTGKKSTKKERNVVSDETLGNCKETWKNKIPVRYKIYLAHCLNFVF